jgi:hypothetical protein
MVDRRSDDGMSHQEEDLATNLVQKNAIDIARLQL